jgi:peptidoglycan/LPS O-acetylase OafA/YrhL
MSQVVPPYRPDVDGLRAIAITSVIVFHVARAWLPGGFIGVDVFFVISGFLIIRIIVGGLEQGLFSLAGFYARRIRRIFPALILVLAAVWTFGWKYMLPEDFAELGRQIVAGAAFASNLLNLSEAGYFDAPAATKPLLHLWSLGIEEQFYLTIPLMLMAAWKWRISIPWVLGVVALSSLASNIVLIRYSQPVAFYLPFTRFWELLAGGGLSYAALHYPGRITKLQSEALSVTGLIFIGGAALLTPASSFPGWWAVPAVLGSVLVIAAGKDTVVNRALSWRPVVAVGLISYPLYLWHWPVIVLMHDDTNFKGRWLVLLSLTLAAGTYFFIERPVRSFRLPRVAITSLATMLVVAVLAAAVVHTDGLPDRYSRAIPAVFLAVPQPAYYPPGYQNGKGNISGPKILLWGDSHADQLNLGFIAVRDRRPIRLYNANFGADCTPMRTRPEITLRRCADLINSIEGQIASLQPDIVIIACYWPYQDRIEGLSESLAFLQQLGVKHLFVVGPVPRWNKALRLMLFDAYLKNPEQGVPVRMDSYVRIAPELEPSLRNIAAKYGATYISAIETLCNSGGCLVRVGDKPGDIIQFDDNHLSKAGSLYFVSRIVGQILKE